MATPHSDSPSLKDDPEIHQLAIECDPTTRFDPAGVDLNR